MADLNQVIGSLESNISLQKEVLWAHLAWDCSGQRCSFGVKISEVSTNEIVGDLRSHLACCLYWLVDKGTENAGVERGAVWRNRTGDMVKWSASWQLGHLSFQQVSCWSMFPSWCNSCFNNLWKSQATVAFVPVGNQLFSFRTVISSNVCGN